MNRWAVPLVLIIVLIFGVMLLIIVVSFQIFAFLEVPFITTIHGYTVGMLFGFYNPLFYIFMTYIALLFITNNKLRLPKWLKLKWSTYWIIVLSIVFISASAGYYQVKNGWFSIGADSWLSFDKWFTDFTVNNNAWLPANTNDGFIGVFLYSFFAMIFSGVGAFIIAILSVLVPVSLLFTGSAWGLYRKIIRKKMLSKRQKNAIIKQSKHDKLNNNNEHQNNNEETEIGITFAEKQEFKQEQTHSYHTKSTDENVENDIKIQEDNDDLPFDDPFS